MKKYRPTISYRLREIPIKYIKVWHDAQARKLDREGIAELAKSIKNEGLQNPPMVQKSGKNEYLLMSGQRRLTALKRLRAKKIPVLVLTRNTEYELKDAKAASVIENLHRKNMNVKDMSAACIFLAEKVGKAKGAQLLGMSNLTFKKYLGFAGVPDKLKQMVPKMISRDDAIKLHQIIPNVNKSIKIAERIAKLDNTTRKRYIQSLAKSPRASHRVLLKRAKILAIRQNIPVKLSRTQAKKLARVSSKVDLAPNEFANKIISQWLKKHKAR